MIRREITPIEHSLFKCYAVENVDEQQSREIKEEIESLDQDQRKKTHRFLYKVQFWRELFIGWTNENVDPKQQLELVRLESEEQLNEDVEDRHFFLEFAKTFFTSYSEKHRGLSKDEVCQAIKIYDFFFSYTQYHTTAIEGGANAIDVDFEKMIEKLTREKNTTNILSEAIHNYLISRSGLKSFFWKRDALGELIEPNLEMVKESRAFFQLCHPNIFLKEIEENDCYHEWYLAKSSNLPRIYLQIDHDHTENWYRKEMSKLNKKVYEEWHEDMHISDQDRRVIRQLKSTGPKGEEETINNNLDILRDIANALLKASQKGLVS